MHTNNTIKLLKLQGKNIKIDKEVINDKNNTATFFISKKIIESSCPCCKFKTRRIHDYRLQKIKHSPLNGYKTTLILKKVRLLCTNCGKKFYMNYNDIVTPKFRSSNELFNKIIEDLQNTSCTFKEVAKLNFVSSGVVTRYLKFFTYLMQWENITTLPKHIGIDEFKGNCDDSKYLFHIYDLDTSQTVYILRTRKYYDLLEFFNTIQNRNEVEIVTMDLYDTFRNAIKAKFKNATIIADRFHYTRIVAKAMDELRREIWRKSSGDQKKYCKHLKLSLLKDIEKVSSSYIIHHEAKLNSAFDLSAKLKYGYQLYQSFLRIKDGDTFEEKCKRFSDWLSDAESSTIKEFKSAAETLLRWSKEIVNSFKYTYTNSSTEGKNNKIKVIKRTSYGFRNLANFRARIKLRDIKV